MAGKTPKRPNSTFNSLLRSSGFSGFIWVFKFCGLFWAHRMSHSCSNGVYGGIEWLFQLKDNEGIEIVFQWF